MFEFDETGQYDSKPKITFAQIREAAEYIFNNTKPPKSDRVIKIIRHCKTYGTILDSTDHLDIKICNDKECTNCQNMLNLFKKSALNFKLND